MALRGWMIIMAMIMASFILEELPGLYKPDEPMRNMCQNIYYDNTSQKICRRGLEGQPAAKSLVDVPSPTGSVHQTDGTYERSTLPREVANRRKKAGQKSIDVDAGKRHRPISTKKRHPMLTQ